MSKDQDGHRPSKSDAARWSIDYEPPSWLSTEQLERELFLAVVADSDLPEAQARFERIDDYFARDEPETELQYRRSLLRLLADLRPQVAELVGSPRRIRITGRRRFGFSVVEANAHRNSEAQRRFNAAPDVKGNR